MVMPAAARSPERLQALAETEGSAKLAAWCTIPNSCPQGSESTFLCERQQEKLYAHLPLRKNAGSFDTTGIFPLGVLLRNFSSMPLQRHHTSSLLDLSKTILQLAQPKVMALPCKKKKKRKVQTQGTKNAIHFTKQGERQNKLLPCCLLTTMSWCGCLGWWWEVKTPYLWFSESLTPINCLCPCPREEKPKKRKSRWPESRLCSVLVSRSYQSLQHLGFRNAKYLPRHLLYELRVSSARLTDSAINKKRGMRGRRQLTKTSKA